MIVQPATAVARAMPVEDDDDDEDDYEEVRPKKKKKKKGTPVSSAANETWMKIAILAGILLITILSIVGVLWWTVFSYKSKPDIVKPTSSTGVPEGSDNRGTVEDDNLIAEAMGDEKFEIPDKQLIHQDFIQSFQPATNLPGLQKNAVKEAGDSLSLPVLERVKKATVYIETESERGSSTGSGFFAVEKGLVFTNAHVIAMLQEGTSKPRNIKVFINHGSKHQQDFKVADVKVDRKNDLAMLRLPSSLQENYPEPLPLASSLTTHETQKVFSLGFPFGNSAGKEVTVTSLTVSSMRYQNDRINAVQFAGALNPGNSGGPIVDSAGRVIAVAVRIFTERTGEGMMTNTGISFGVPCDEVSALFHGRADRLELYPPIRRGSSLVLPVMLSLTEHSSRKVTPRIKVTLGESKNPPESPANSDTAEALKNSESRQTYTGSIPLPEWQQGKVYWLQSQMTFGEDQVNWLEPVAFQPKTILEEKALPAAPAGESNPATMKFQQRYLWNINMIQGGTSVRMDYAATTTGKNQPLKDLRIGAKAGDRAFSHQTLNRLWQNRIGENDIISQGVKLSTMLTGNLGQWQAIAQLNVPRDSVPVGKSWKLQPQSVFLDYLFGYDAEQQCRLSCEYLGAYEETGNLVGVIRVHGDITDTKEQKTPYGKLSGLALIDGKTRQLIDFMLRCDARKKVSSGNSSGTLPDPYPSIEGVMQLRMQRKGS